jgi:hypothetical protein
MVEHGYLSYANLMLTILLCKRDEMILTSDFLFLSQAVEWWTDSTISLESVHEEVALLLSHRSLEAPLRLMV